MLTASDDRTANLKDRKKSAVFSPDESKVFTASVDHATKLWDSETVVDSSDSSRVIAASVNHTAKLWDSETAVDSSDVSRVLTASIDQTTNLCDSAMFSPDGSSVFTAVGQDIKSRGSRYIAQDGWGSWRSMPKAHLESNSDARLRDACVGTCKDTTKIWSAETGECTARAKKLWSVETGKCISDERVHQLKEDSSTAKQVSELSRKWISHRVHRGITTMDITPWDMTEASTRGKVKIVFREHRFGFFIAGRGREDRDDEAMVAFCNIDQDLVKDGRVFFHRDEIQGGKWMTFCLSELLSVHGVHPTGGTVDGRVVRFISNSAGVLQRIDEEVARSSGVRDGITGNRKHELCRAVRQGASWSIEDRRRRIDRVAREAVYKFGKVPPAGSDASVLSLTTDGQFWDDAKGGMLDPRLVTFVRQEEVRFVKGRQVYDKVPWETAIQRTGRLPIRTRWVDTNKGTEEAFEYRSRWVAQKFRRGADAAFYVATPPLEAIREIVSDVVGHGGDKVLLVVDVRRAYLYAPAAKEMYVELPPEDSHDGRRMCGRLNISLYGTRDAAHNWETELRSTLKTFGFFNGKASPVHFHPRGWRALAAAHGDDLAVSIPRCHVDRIVKAISGKYEIKTQVLGGNQGEMRTVKLLNPTICWGKDGITWEGDSRHARIVIERLGLERAKGVDTLGSFAPQLSEAETLREIESELNYQEEVRQHIGDDGHDMRDLPELVENDCCDEDDRWGSVRTASTRIIGLTSEMKRLKSPTCDRSTVHCATVVSSITYLCCAALSRNSAPR